MTRAWSSLVSTEERAASHSQGIVLGISASVHGDFWDYIVNEGFASLKKTIVKMEELALICRNERNVFWSVCVPTDSMDHSANCCQTFASQIPAKTEENARETVQNPSSARVFRGSRGICVNFKQSFVTRTRARVMGSVVVESPVISGKISQTSGEYQLSFPTPPSTLWSAVVVPYGLGNRAKKEFLEELFICFWMRSPKGKVVENLQGTPFSYSTEDSPDAFTLSNYNGFVFSVNGEERNTNVSSGDGLWHHMCVGWRSSDGTWALMKDGEVADFGNGLSEKKPLSGRGVFVLGQEQDTIGGGFSLGESFTGTLAKLEAFSFVPWLANTSLASGQVWGNPETHFFNCELAPKGDLMTWSDFLEMRQGNVKVEMGDLCSGCPIDWVPFTHGIASDNHQGALGSPGEEVAFSCDDGFRLIGAKVRRCMISGSWNEPVPRCERIPCEFLGQPKEVDYRLIKGTKYEFESVVRFSCVSGYYLKEDHLDLELTCLANGKWSGKPPSCIDSSSALSKVEMGDLCSGCPIDWVPFTHGIASDNHQGALGSPGEEVAFSCDDGFRLIGAKVRRCMISGSWNEPVPRCERIPCEFLGQPKEVDYRLIKGTKYEFESVVRFSCVSGYYLKEDHLDLELTCLANGKWSGKPPSCIAKSCQLEEMSSNVQFVTNSQDSGGMILVDDVVGVECLEGLLLVGNSAVKCSPRGTWSPRVPACIQPSCYFEPKIPNAKSVDFVPGKSLTLECEPGFEMFGEEIVLCKEDNQWPIESIPMCDPVSCPLNSIEISNGFLSTSSGDSLGDSATIRCKPGFEFSSSPRRRRRTLRCSQNATWVPEKPGETFPSCAVKPCRRPEFRNGDVKMIADNGPTVAIFSCHEGFTLQGNRKLKCPEHGTHWGDDVPKCVKSVCSQFPPVFNANISAARGPWGLGEEVEITCQKGFWLEHNITHSNTPFCRADGTWGRLLPICHPIECENPPNFRHAILDTRFTVAPLSRGKNHLLSSRLFYRCKDGFSMRGEEGIICGDDKKWHPVESRFPECVRNACQMIPEMKHRRYFLRKISPGILSAVFSCEPGFQMRGDPETLCTKHGNWSRVPPTCEPIECDPSRLELTLKHAKNVTVTGHGLGSALVVECDDGFELSSGDWRRVCLGNNMWSGSPAECTPVGCPRPSITHSDVALPSSFSSSGFSEVGMKITFECPPGFRAMESLTRTCSINGTWLPGPEVPQCEPVACPGIASIPNGRVIGGDFRFRSIVQFSCDLGFGLTIESGFAQCSANATWIPDIPQVVCEQRFCPRPSAPENGYLHSADASIGSTIKFDCDIGYQVKGEDTITCLANGSWSSSLGECAPEFCHPLENFLIDFDCIKVTYDEESDSEGNFPHGTRGVLTKRPGFVSEPDENLVATCGSAGIWHIDFKPELLKCEEIKCREPFPKGPNSFLVSNPEHEFPVGTSVTYQCDPGFISSGSLQMSCSPNGQWNPETPPTCEEMSCQPFDVKDFENGGFKTKTSGKFVVFECDPDFEMVGRNFSECLNGSWTNPVPKCVKFPCKGLSDFQHGTVLSWTPSQIDDGADLEVSFTCDPGYFSWERSPKITCFSNNGSWSAQVPSCNPVTCPRIVKNPDNGVLSSSGVTSGKSTWLKCDDGFVAFGPSKVTCLHSGNWSNVLGSCVPSLCPETPDLSHGIWEPSVQGSESLLVVHSEMKGFQQGTIFKLRCNKDQGYHAFQKEVSITCESSRWVPSGKVACVANLCEIPPVPKNALVHNQSGISGNTLLVNQSISYRCKHGFIAANDNEDTSVTIRTCLTNGTLSGSVIRCEEISCPDLQKITHGNLTISGRSAFYKCDPGFKLDNVSLGVKACSISGKWIPSREPECVKVTCDAPKIPNHAEIETQHHHHQQQQLIVDEFPVGHVLRLACAQGFEPKFHGVPSAAATGTMTCLQNGTWFGTLTCSETECPVLNQTSSSGAKINTISRSVGGIAVYSCETPGILDFEGHSTRVCLPDGHWSLPEPKCKHPCGTETPTDFENAFIKASGNNWTIECKSGFGLRNGDGRVKCAYDRVAKRYEWTASGDCSRIQCEFPGGSEDFDEGRGVVSRSEDVLVHQCNYGFKLKGPERKICSPDGHWTPEGESAVIQPSCEPIKCDPQELASLLNNSYIVDTDYPYGIHNILGTVVRYACTPGNRLLVDEKVRKKSMAEASSDSRTASRNNKKKRRRRMLGQKIKCESDASWFKQGPNCVPHDCRSRRPPDFRFTTRNVTHLRNGQAVAVYACLEGFRLRDTDTIFCRHGFWENVVKIECSRVVCKDPPLTLHSFLTEFDVGNSQNSDTMLIIPVGQISSWMSQTPPYFALPTELGSANFQRVDGNRVPLANGKIILDKENSTVSYECDLGFYLFGASKRYCDYGSEWSGSAPTCSPVRCPTIGAPKNGFIVSPNHGYVYQSRIEFGCSPGYRLDGSRVAVCGPDGKWSPDVPLCSVPKCDAPELNAKDYVIPMPTKTGGGALRKNRRPRWKPGTSLEIECQKGRFTSGNMTITCFQNGTWSQLKGPRCGIPRLRNGAYVQSFSLLRKDVVRYLCPAGKMPYGSELLRCLPDNTWDRAGFCVNRPASPFCPRRCLNNGTCTDFYKCTCPQGFMGKRCEQPVCEPECLNGGLCIQRNTCFCPKGFDGKICESRFLLQESNSTTIGISGYFRQLMGLQNMEQPLRAHEAFLSRASGSRWCWPSCVDRYSWCLAAKEATAAQPSRNFLELETSNWKGFRDREKTHKPDFLRQDLVPDRGTITVSPEAMYEACDYSGKRRKQHMLSECTGTMNRHRGKCESRKAVKVKIIEADEMARNFASVGFRFLLFTTLLLLSDASPVAVDEGGVPQAGNEDASKSQLVAFDYGKHVDAIAVESAVDEEKAAAANDIVDNTDTKINIDKDLPALVDSKTESRPSTVSPGLEKELKSMSLTATELRLPVRMFLTAMGLSKLDVNDGRKFTAFMPTDDVFKSMKMPFPVLLFNHWQWIATLPTAHLVSGEYTTDDLNSAGRGITSLNGTQLILTPSPDSTENLPAEFPGGASTFISSSDLIGLVYLDRWLVDQWPALAQDQHKDEEWHNPPRGWIIRPSSSIAPWMRKLIHEEARQ
ncbi:unnamed protein product [Notodromas monacha]|uniref:Sushi, von Willebrand factor type A, EGF and pentraxin domain-containing protein 1 n=1 Tax=Notodromas monacha TaxID=399045 RepID=A0A7R9BH83_9CRUS|nr:unnamed protein product [Notodromas monacha]CAG0914385.1 unnamed protein product [Notodromas monacha]